MQVIDRANPYYQAAKDRVKIGFFTEKGYDIRGVIHVGANDGYEVPYYLHMGIKNVLCFEPLAEARYEFKSRNPTVECVHYALGNYDGTGSLCVTPGDGKGSSFLPLPKWDTVVRTDTVEMVRFATIADAVWKQGDYNCLVVDVQGMELDVLRGMDDHLKKFDFLSIECSQEPIYKGEAPADEVVRFLDRMGFQQDSPIQPHDDVMFINRAVLHPPEPPKPFPTGTMLNVGSGQRPFDQEHGWINIDAQERWNPDLVADWNDLSMFDDGTMDLAVSHHSLEHVGCGEGVGFIREAYRVLKPGGSLIVTVPDMRALAQRWLTHQITTQIYMTAVYGAYMGNPHDRHAWGYDAMSLRSFIAADGDLPWRSVNAFDWRAIPGASIAKDWWILGWVAIK